jgi:lipopolysaccharide export system ATP-binding protein
MAILSLQNLVKYYHGKQVVNSVSLDVESGVVVGLLGPNGAGKTTTFYMAVGMVKPDKGRVLLDDEDITDYPMYMRARRGVGYLPQETSIFRKLTVKQNIMAVLEIISGAASESAGTDRRHVPTDDREAHTDKLLDELGIRHLSDRKAGVLSGGERRRLEITRALATDPCFILLDEPFAGVDPLAVIDIKQIIAHLKKRGIGILISDHNVRETLGACDSAYILSDGKIIESGPPEKIASSETARRIYLGDEFKL